MWTRSVKRWIIKARSYWKVLKDSLIDEVEKKHINIVRVVCEKRMEAKQKRKLVGTKTEFKK